VIDRPIAFHNLSIREMYLLHSGTLPRTPGVLAKSWDRLSTLATRRLGTRSIVNRLSRLFFSHGPSRALHV
jgi:hypothetical protein